MADGIFGGFARGAQTGMALRKQQAALDAQREKDARAQKAQGALASYRQQQLAISQKRAEIAERQADLQMANGLTRILTDPKMHPEARAWMLDEVVTAAGHDPKSERYQGLKKVILKMPVDQANALAEAIADGMPNSEPGAIRGLVDNLLKGNVSPGEIPKIIQDMQTSQVRSDVLGNAEGGQTAAAGDISADMNGLPAIAGTVFEPEAPQAPPEDNAIGLADWLSDPASIRDKARRLGAANDYEGARMLLQMARDVEGQGKQYEDTETKELAKRNVDLLKSLDADVNTARKSEASIQVFETALEGGRFTPGTLSGPRQVLSQIAEFVGLNPEDPTMKMLLGTGDPATAEAMHAAGNRLALDLAENLSKMTNMSLSFVADSVPNLMRTPAGNKIIIDMIRAGNRRVLEAHDRAEEMLQRYGTLNPKGKRSFQQEMRAIMDKPLFDEAFVKRVKEESRRGQGVQLEEGMNILGGAGNAEQTEITSGDGRRKLQVISDNDGKTMVQTEYGVVPLVRTTEEYDAMEEGDIGVWWPTGQVFMRRKKPPAPGANR